MFCQNIFKNRSFEPIKLSFKHTLKNAFANISFIALLAVLFTSCNAVKRVGENEHLLMENTVYVNDKKDKSEELTNLIYQKPNGRLPFLGTPIRLHIYNLARPNIDSILIAKYRNPENPKTGLKKLLSLKQYEALVRSKKNINTWFKTTGEAPVIVDEEKAERSKALFKKYYFVNGWFDAEIDYTIDKKDNKRASVNYLVQTGKPYHIDSISTKIATPAIDSIFNTRKEESLIKKGEQFREANFTLERDRITDRLRNSGFYHFTQDYITFDIDTIGATKKVNADIVIQNRLLKTEDSTRRVPFKIYKIKEVNIFTDSSFENKDATITDSATYNNYNIYSYGKLRYRPKALTDAVFITKDRVFRDLSRTRTYNYLSELKIFRYPNIEYIENVEDTTLTANIYLNPRKRFGLNFSTEVMQSNIQSVGFSFSTGLLIRNIFRGAEILEVSAIGSIGASKDNRNPEDPFFDINEIGGNIRLTIPRLFLPFNTDKIIPKYMSPSTRISASATSQRNIGLDKQTLTGILSYNWSPSRQVTNTLDLFNVQYVKNLNTDNYFGVYQNSYNSLNSIARDIGYIPNDENLGFPDGAETFIDDVLAGNTSINPGDDDFLNVNNINQRKRRLSENNLILATSFNYVKNRRANLYDNNFSIIRIRGELAGNLLSNLSKLTGAKKDEQGRYDVFGVAFSQYAKAEVDYVKYFDLGKKNVFAFRSYLGLAVPYGNSENIPFAKSFFAGGPNDNRAWTAYNLGPGSSKSFNEFNEANLKIHLSAEQRFQIFGKFYGAVFADVGNIWNVLDNVEDDAATFDGLKSLEDIALGSGFGLRYDLSFFVIRLDIGFKTYDPAYDLGNRWFKDYNFKNAVYNIGINYPF